MIRFIKRNREMSLVIAISLILFITISIMIGIKLNANKNQDIVPNQEVTVYQDVSDNNESKELLASKAKDLKTTYKDVVGYLKVSGTNIDEAVFQSTDNSRYLRNNRDNTNTGWGEFFLDYRCDINKIDNMTHYIIYGHNSQDSKNFSELVNYKNEQFYKDNQYIEFSTVDKDYKYQIFSVYITTPDFFYIDVLFNNTDEYKEFIDSLKIRSMYDTGVEVDENDKILTLSTCDYSMDNARFVVQAKLVK